MAPTEDRRWQRFTDQAYRCPCCGKAVQGVMDIGYDHPDPWPHASYRSTGGTVVAGRDVLTGDLCTLGNSFYLRGLLTLPIIGAGQSFSFGPWAEVSQDTFQCYKTAFGTEEELALGTPPARLANDLPGFPGSSDLPLRIAFSGGSARPEFALSSPGHALARAQSEGLSFDSLLDLYAAFGHDLRPHLGQA